jgi:hypothetical protein
MRRIAYTFIVIGFTVTMFAVEASAQSRAGRGALMGGLTGAAIGGATRGGRGALVGSAIGLGVGSLIGGQMERRRGNYYWYNGRCWMRFRNGEFHPVANRYCR